MIILTQKQRGKATLFHICSSWVCKIENRDHLSVRIWWNVVGIKYSHFAMDCDCIPWEFVSFMEQTGPNRMQPSFPGLWSLCSFGLEINHCCVLSSIKTKMLRMSLSSIFFYITCIYCWWLFFYSLLNLIVKLVKFYCEWGIRMRFHQKTSSIVFGCVKCFVKTELLQETSLHLVCFCQVAAKYMMSLLFFIKMHFYHNKIRRHLPVSEPINVFREKIPLE